LIILIKQEIFMIPSSSPYLSSFDAPLNPVTETACDTPPDYLKGGYKTVNANVYYSLHVDFEEPGTGHIYCIPSKLMYAGYYQTREVAEAVNQAIITMFGQYEEHKVFHTKIVEVEGTYALFPGRGYYSIFSGRSVPVIKTADENECERAVLKVAEKIKEWAPDFWCKLQSDKPAALDIF
jgi:hypothetical protein